MVCFGSALLVIAHALLAYPVSSPPIVPLTIQGLGYTICVSALWPSVPFTVNEDSVGTAFGIMMGVQNVGLALMPLGVAHLYHINNNRYLPSVENAFAASSLLAFIVGVALLLIDRSTDLVLSTPKVNILFHKERIDDGNASVEFQKPAARANSDAALLVRGKH